MRMLGCAVALMAVTGCVVTDDIVFRAQENNPPEFVHADPDSGVVQVAAVGEQLVFTAVVWDPDERDVPLYDAVVTVVESAGSGLERRVTTGCAAPVEIDGDRDFGVYLSFSCAVVIQPLDASLDVVMVEMEVSDRGYVAGGAPAEDARTARMHWTYRLVDTDAQP